MRFVKEIVGFVIAVIVVSQFMSCSDNLEVSVREEYIDVLNLGGKFVNIIDNTALKDIEIFDLKVNNGVCKTDFKGKLASRAPIANLKPSDRPKVGDELIVLWDEVDSYWRRNKAKIFDTLLQEKIEFLKEYNEYDQEFISEDQVRENVLVFLDEYENKIDSAYKGLSPKQKEEMVQKVYAGAKEVEREAREDLERSIRDRYSSHLYDMTKNFYYRDNIEIRVDGINERRLLKYFLDGSNKHNFYENYFNLVKNLMKEYGIVESYYGYIDLYYDFWYQTFHPDAKNIVASNITDRYNKIMEEQRTIKKLEDYGVKFEEKRKELNDELFWSKELPKRVEQIEKKCQGQEPDDPKGNFWHSGKIMCSTTNTPYKPFQKRPEGLEPMYIKIMRVVEVPSAVIKLKEGESIGGYHPHGVTSRIISATPIPKGIQVYDCNVKKVEITTNKGKEVFKF